MISNYKISNQLMFFEESDGSCVMYHRKSNREIYLGKMEYEVLKMIDGKSNEVQILEKFPALEKDQLYKLLKIFCEKGLIKGYEHKNKMKLSDINIFYIPSSDFKRINAIYLKESVRILFGTSMAVAFLMSVIGSDIFVDCFNNFVCFLDDFNILNFLKISSIIIFSIFFHEMGHAITAKATGVHIVQYNFGLNVFFPCVRTVYCGIKKLKNVQIIKIDIAGILTNMWLYSLGCMLWIITKNSWCQFFSLYNLTLAMFNLIIVLNTDGQHILLIMLGLEEFKLKKYIKLEKKIDSDNLKNCYIVIYYYIIYIFLLIGIYYVCAQLRSGI